MSLGSSIVSIVNRSLLGVGGRNLISALTENSPAAVASNLLYQPTFAQLARAAWWNCLRRQATMTLLKAAQGTPENQSGTSLPLPPSPWLYEYLLPADCLHMRYLVPTLPVTGVGTVPLTTINNAAPTLLPNDGQIPFVVGYDTDALGNPLTVVLTNQNQAQAIYTVNQSNPSVWDSQFEAAMVAGLGAFLAPPLTLNLELMKMQIGVADGIIMQARAADANEGYNTQDNVPDWIRARRGSGSLSYGNSLYNYPNFVPVTWPSY